LDLTSNVQDLFRKFNEDEPTGNLNEGSIELVCTCVENRRKNQGNLLVSAGQNKGVVFSLL
jgi:ABC-type lipoprotein export system ATPase subunit